MSDWIPVTERLPESSQFVLVTCYYFDTHNETVEAFYNEESQSFWEGDLERLVIAWMPLPQPYQPSPQ